MNGFDLEACHKIAVFIVPGYRGLSSVIYQIWAPPISPLFLPPNARRPIIPPHMHGPTTCLALGATLGKGAFSHVRLVHHSCTPYACKQVALDTPHKLDLLLNEVNTLRTLDHPNIVQVHGFSIRGMSRFEILLEYVQGVTLEQKFGGVDEETLLYWIFQITHALLHMKERGVVHRDIKPSNILVDEANTIKIIDFGMAKLLCKIDTEPAGTPLFMAPEIAQHRIATCQSDIWSLGMTLHQLLHRRPPSLGITFHNNTSSVTLSYERINFDPSVCSPELGHLIQQMVVIDPRLRITPEGILQHEAIRSRNQQFGELYSRSLFNAGCK